MIGYITRKYELDYGHRIIRQIAKCNSYHGHRGTVLLNYQFTQSKEIGYAIDFSEIKRIGCQWMDDHLDHSFLANPLDSDILIAVKATKSRFWTMSLNGEGEFCNPSAENISKEIFLTQEILFEDYGHFNIHQITFYETPNCWTDCFKESISDSERANFYKVRYEQIKQYAKEKGIVEYDSTKIQK